MLVRRLFLPLALLLGCPTAPAVDDDDSTEPPVAGLWDDPLVRLDGWNGGSFAELADLEVRGDQVAFCTGVQGLQLWSIADPENLTQLDEIGFSAGSSQYPRCQHVSLSDDSRIYASNRSDSIQRTAFLAVVDATNPGALLELGVLETDYSPEGHVVHDGLLLVTGHEAGLIIYERGDGADLTEIARLPTGNAWNVRTAGDIAFVSDSVAGLVAVDISEPAAPAVLASLALPGPAKDLELVGDLAYVGLGAGGVATVDISAPSSPELASVVDTPGSALGLAVGDSKLFVADWNDLRIFDLSDPRQPAPVGHEPLPLGAAAESRTLGIAASGDLVLAGNWTELVSYRSFDHSAPDVVMTPRFLQLGEVDAGDEVGGIISVSNEGTEPLFIEDIELAGDGLTVSGLVAGEGLDPGDSVNLVVRYAATANNAWQGDVVITTDDPDEPALTTCVRANSGGLQPGSEFPGRTWLDVDGNEVNSADHEGEVVMLAYFATF